MTKYNEKVVAFDVDSTLIKLSATGELRLDYYGTPGQYKILIKNVEQIKSHLKRGWMVIIWSHSGPVWAEQVIDALGIDKTDLLIMNKPLKIFDDEDASEFMPKKVHLHLKDI